MQITYEQIKQVLTEKGYLFELQKSIPEGWPELTGRTLVTITPEMAQSLLKHSGKLNKALQKRSNQIFNSIIYGTWTSDMDEIDLLQNYKLWSRTVLMNAIANGGHPVDVYVNMKEDNKFGFGEENTAICKELIDAIKEVLENNGKELPELEQSVWETELPKLLCDKLDIQSYDYVRGINASDIPLEHQILVGVLNSDRTEEFPDMLYIVDNDATGNATGFKCSLFPAINSERKLILKPGIYKELLTPDDSSDIGYINLIQANPANLSTAILKNNQIVGYEDSIFKFMRIGIPTKDEEPGLFPVGVKFDSTNTEDLFITNFNFDFISSNITYIIIETKDFQ